MFEEGEKMIWVWDMLLEKAQGERRQNSRDPEPGYNLPFAVILIF